MKEINVLEPENIRRGPEQIKAAMCYIFCDGRVLMINRRKEPFAGMLVVPGGKFEKGETPFDCIKREIFEETGLIIEGCNLKIVTSELGPEHYNWLLYIFVCDEFSGEIVESPEGELCWVDKESLSKQNMSEIDKKMLPYVMDKNKYFMKLKYDSQKNCTIEEIMLLNEDYTLEQV